MYKNLLLCGFRATGKTTIGQLVAKELGWDYVEMDAVITKQSGKSIPELTKNGTTWQEFRSIETDVLKKLLHKDHVVISAGGGVGVNTIPNSNGTTFGKEQEAIIATSKDTCVFVLTADAKTIRKRMYSDEMKKAEIMRPVLDEEKAAKLAKEIKGMNTEQQKEITVQYIIEDAITMMRLRDPLYAKLSTNRLDTGIVSTHKTAKSIVQFMKES